ncbi:P1 family peptidase [Streptomyces sp. NRRL F-5126]|uniref:P1 family peptidase n=1 Tax=Streptomyces sp. NRRL F-5126 TaxID=1463857 RepID=UPI000A5C26F6|nr:P1 family peptidase [Streptomyces sp. NRRL F-5126]
MSDAARGGSLTDVAGLRVGHAEVAGERALTGTTVVLAPDGGVAAAVDVRGGGPATRETDALDPRNLVDRVEAVVLTGGSAYGLDAASGVVAWLEEQGRGVRIPDRRHVVPVVPAAAVFDLGRGGAWGIRPDAATGRAAVEAAAASRERAPVAEGSVGAGRGAAVGPLKGGVGTASTVLGASGVTVAALVVANAAGSAVDPLTGALYGRYYEGRVAYPPAEVHEAARVRLEALREGADPAPLNTTLAVVATDADMSRSQAQKMAGTAHDGIARAVRPVHLLNDGDTVFGLATGVLPLREDMSAVNEILSAAADVVTRAIVRAVLAAESVHGPGGVFPSYRELYGPDRWSGGSLTRSD